MEWTERKCGMKGIVIGFMHMFLRVGPLISKSQKNFLKRKINGFPCMVKGGPNNWIKTVKPLEKDLELVTSMTPNATIIVAVSY